MLRIGIKKDPMYIMNKLNSWSAKTPHHCFSFDLSIFAKREKHDSESEYDRPHSREEFWKKKLDKMKNTLVRVDWKG